jgi:Ni/Fe-hydrogenase subunit HybB-like protein
MNCPHCNAAIHQSDYNCPACGKLTATSREDLNRIDAGTSKGVAWAMIVMSLLGFIFVIVNSQQEWYSPLNFVAPVIVLVAGIASLVWINAKSKR